jgi:hypothetical protein
VRSDEVAADERITLRRHDLAAEIYHLKEPHMLPLTISPGEAKRLLAMAGNLKTHAMLALMPEALYRQTRFSRHRGA